MNETPENQSAWLFQFKRKILLVLLLVLTLSVLVTVGASVVLLRENLLENSRQRATELNRSIEASLRQLMLLGKPEVLQEAIEGIRTSQDHLSTIFIIDRSGKVAYASDRTLLGRTMDRFHDPTCTACHKSSRPPDDVTMILATEAGDVQRNINVIFNEPACQPCHPPEQKINGKLFVDRSLRDTDKLIFEITLIIVASGLACIVLLAFFLRRLLARGLDRYINEIIRQNAELNILFMMIDRLSATIDIEELKQIVLNIFRDVFDPDEVALIMQKEARDLRCTAWTRTDGSFHRQKIESDSPLARVVATWSNGLPLAGSKESEDGTLYVPIEKNGHPLALVRLTRNDGHYDPLRLKMLAVIASHVAVALENSRLYFIAITDELTHLYTARHFRFCLGRSFENFLRFGEKFSLLMIDIDNFKMVNDTYGHPVGDTVLAGVSRCLLDSLRDNDLPFRYGGEEFAVLLPGTDQSGAHHVAERIRADVAATTFDPGGSDLRLTVSIGVACCPQHADSMKALILAADQALYSAKRNGKNRVFITPGPRQ